ncbi:MAG TPA: beta-N-acetylglucosaminidase domain-containing protein [Steroidobacteraceae bacterium]|nr:beta-N-acetylglucosaminidase domain-containing protein [Steroidobacteraceae bacterium]
MPFAAIRGSALTFNNPAPSGVIEGFFGKTWPDAARLACAPFLRAYGFDFYIYAPKADRYLRRAWAEQKPQPEIDRLAALSEGIRGNGLRFGVGLTPYEIHLDYGTAARAALERKVAQLDQVGVDILCILFDDMRGDVPGLADTQARVIADITARSSAGSFIVCPTYYSDDPVLERLFGKAPAGYLQDFGRRLDPAIDVFWTGARVCSAGYSDAHLDNVAERLGRKPFIWDNNVANDGKVRSSHLYLDPNSMGWSMNPQLTTGVAINPMNQPCLSRLALANYASLLRAKDATRDEAGFESNLRSLCSAPLAAAILEDLDLFQNRGLTEIDNPGRERLIEKYRRFEPDDCALEIIAWLRDEYRFDPNCLTD